MPLLASVASRIRVGRCFVGLGLPLLLASALTSAPSAFAQYSDYGSSQSSVTINWGALDALGPASKEPGTVKRDHAAKPTAKAQRPRKVVLHHPAKHAKKTAHKPRHPAQTRAAASAKRRVAHTATKSTPKPAAKVTPASTALAAHTARAAKPTTAAAPAPIEPMAKAAAALAPTPVPATAAGAPVEAAAPMAPSAPAVAEPSAPSRPLEAPAAAPAPTSEPHLAVMAAPAARETVQITPAVATTLASRAGALLVAGEDERERVLTLEDSFVCWAATAGRLAAEVHWFETEGGTTDIVAQWGRRADAIVVGRPRREDWLSREALRMALFGTDRPILMVPPTAAMPEEGAAFGRSIAIAWRDEKPALRAVLPALRWFSGAERMHLLVGVRDTARRVGVPSVLPEHGLTASLHVLPIRPGPFGQTLLDKAHELSADLMVMGAYAHSPLRELVLGGVTRHMLTHADLPVLMRH